MGVSDRWAKVMEDCCFLSDKNKNHRERTIPNGTKNTVRLIKELLIISLGVSKFIIRKKVTTKLKKMGNKKSLKEALERLVFKF